MRFRILILIVAVLVCVGLGLWQRENIDIVWREYSSFYRHIRYEGHSMKIRGPFISARVAKQDPEAAAVADVRLVTLYAEPDETIQPIADKLLECPDNRFLLFELVRGLCGDRCVIDRQIILRYVDRLIALEPENAHYHYAKCYLLLTDSNDIDAALAELECANRSQEYSLPYDSYKQRAIEIAEQARVGRFFMAKLQEPVLGGLTSFVIWRQLMAQAVGAFSDGDEAKGLRINDALSDIQERQLRDGDPRAGAIRNLRFWSGAYNFGHWDEPHGLELQRAKLTRERAKENRLALCSLMATPKNIAEKKKDQYEKEHRSEKIKKQEAEDAAIAAYPAVHFIQMFIALSCGCAILLLICAIRGFGEKSRIGFTEVLLFLVVNICYFCIVKFIFLVQFFESLSNYLFGCRIHFSYIDALMPIPGLKYIEVIPLSVGFFLVGPIVIALVLRRIGRRLYRCRIIRLFLATIFLGSVTVLAGGYRYINYLPMIVFVLACAIIAMTKPKQASALKTTLRLFSRRPDVAAIRNKCLKVISPFIAVYWVLFVFLTPLAAKSINLGWSESKPTDRSIILADPNEAYQEIMSTFEAKVLQKEQIRRLLGLVMAEDLPALLQRLKTKEFADYQWAVPPRKGASEEEKARWERNREQGRRLNDGDLIRAMRGCGRDVVDIITGFLDNPDAEAALVARARLGDITAKEKLEEFLQIRLDSELEKKENEQDEHYKSYPNIPVKVADIIGALACVCEPNESAERFLDYIQNREVCLLIEEHEFFIYISLLPRTQARRVIGAYLDKVASWQPHEEPTAYCRRRHSWRNVLRPLRELAGFYGDRQISEEIFEIMLSAADNKEERNFEPLDISPYFDIRSAELLKKGLDHSNADMRAWCVWQLRSIGYNFSRSELVKLLNDESWKVRANAVFAGGKEAGDLAKSDRYPFVRLVANLK